MSINVRSPPGVDVIPWFQALSSYSASIVSNSIQQNFPFCFFRQQQTRNKETLKTRKRCFWFGAT